MRQGLAILILSNLIPFSPMPASLHPQIIEGLVNIRFQLDVRVFAVMAAIHGAGFDLDAASLEENVARRLLRERLLRLEPGLRNRLREFYLNRDFEQDAVKQQSKYLSYSLLLNGPPGFDLSLQRETVPVDARPLVGFERLVKELWEKGELSQLWEDLRPQYVREIESYRPLIRSTILDCLRYMRTEARVALDRQVIFIPDLLGGNGIVNARNVGQNYFLVVGPSRTRTKPMRPIQHEYLHFMVDPLVAKYTAYLPEPEPFLKLIGQRPKVHPRYHNEFLLMVTESIIHMMELRLDSLAGEGKDKALISDYDEGLILAPYCLEALERFEKRQQSFQEFFPELIQGIRLETEKGRSDAIAKLKSDLAARRSKIQEELEARERAKIEIRNMLVRANDLLMAKEYEKAKVLLEEVLRRDSANANALYAMAQLASRDQELDRALELYEHAAATAGENVWIAAWCFVRRGNIYQFRGDAARARHEWLKVGELKGDLRGASEAAAKALASAQP